MFCIFFQANLIQSIKTSGVDVAIHSEIEISNDIEISDDIEIRGNIEISDDILQENNQNN